LDWLMNPVMPYLGDEALTIFGPFEGFTFKFKVALYVTLVFTSPILIWQVLAFFLPALKPKERRYFVPTFIAAVLLFVAGNWFCYSVVLAKAFEWLIGQAAGLQVIPAAPAFLTGITLLMLGFGLAFELPVVVFYLIAFGIVPYKKMRENWRVAYVALLIVASVATPDWSPVTMGALFAALLVLYEGSLALARVLLVKRIRAQQAAELAEE
ncbi:MAG: twin-arginine translocase subunit TatC, partial [Actinomycetota bacterium]|nr:twin-arginine translocase subunit TatC [Actinomycetota bacterium]